jgi:hypothetical protein
MSAHTDPRPSSHRRQGFALLLALVVLTVVSICVLALWQLHAGARRSDRLRTATLAAQIDADSMLALGLDAVTAGGWRGLAFPGDWLTTHHGRSASAERSTAVARLGWGSLLVRGLVTRRTGVSRVEARADQRLLVPLLAPMPMPSAALHGAQPWTILPSADLGSVVPTPAERRCRDGIVPQRSSTDSVPVALDATQVTLLDPDTVSAPLEGVYRLIHGRIRRSMVVRGVVESVTGLTVGADLQIVGVLVAQGSVQPAGGRLDVTGAVIARDSGGAGSVLGNGDRVRYDACAIRRAVERATRPAPAVTWTAVGHP